VAAEWDTSGYDSNADTARISETRSTTGEAADAYDIDPLFLGQPDRRTGIAVTSATMPPRALMAVTVRPGHGLPPVPLRVRRARSWGIRSGEGLIRPGRSTNVIRQKFTP
jgi:hypothetical protein